MSCAISHHFSQLLKSHSMNYLCENCRDEAIGKLFCDDCGQVLCHECDKIIHNKGKRARHAREEVSSVCLERVANMILVTGSFLQQQVDLSNSRLEFLEVLRDLEKRSCLEKEKSKFSLVVLVDDVQNAGYELFSELVKEENFKNVLVYKAFSDAFSSVEESKENSLMIHTVELFGKIEVLYLFGTAQNEQIVHLLEDKVEQIFSSLGSSSAKEVDPTLQSDSLKFLDQMVPFSQDTLSQDGDFFISAAESYIESFQCFKDDDTVVLSEKENVNPNAQKPKVLSQQKVKEIESFVLKELTQTAKMGEPLILKEVLIGKIQKTFQIGDLEVELLMSDFQSRGLIHSVIRKFLNYRPYHYFGLLLKGLDVASLIHVLKSIKNDRMTPTEKLILSRIKECYGLKIDQNQWKSILTSISSSQSADPMHPLKLKQISDPVTQMETHAIYLTNEDWIEEDQGEVDYNSNEWILFERFLNEFFKDEQKEVVPVEISQRGGGSRWNSSVENILTKTCFENDHDKSLSNSGDTKAIPGGRYGCVQFLKYCGPEGLKSQSLGKLSLLVQAAINKGIVKYHKTLLIKNTSYQEETVDSRNNLDFETEILHSLNEQRKNKLISTVREALLEILMENPTGIALAQIPFQLKRKLRMSVDFQELGYAKLKDFLASMKNLIIFEASNTNHIIVKLKNPVTIRSHPSSKNTSMRKENSVYNASRNISKNNNNNVKNYNNNSRVQSNYGYNQPIPMNKNAIIAKVLFYLEQLLKQRPQGTSIQDLYQKLASQVEIEKTLKLIECPNFYDFLIHYAENLVVIGAAKNGYTIYPKIFGSFYPNTNMNKNGTSQSFEKSFLSEDHYANGFDRTSDRTQKFFNENEPQNKSQVFSLSHYIDASTLSMSYSSVASNYSANVEQSTFDNQKSMARKRVPFGNYDTNVKSCNQSYDNEFKSIPRENYKLNFSEIQKPPQCASSNANLRYIEDLLQERDEMKGFLNDSSNNQSGFALGRFFPSS